MNVNDTKTIGIVVCCQTPGCREKLGEVFFPSGAATFFGCAKCGKDVVNTFAATPFGLIGSVSRRGGN